MVGKQSEVGMALLVSSNDKFVYVSKTKGKCFECRLPVSGDLCADSEAAVGHVKRDVGPLHRELGYGIFTALLLMHDFCEI